MASARSIYWNNAKYAYNTNKNQLAEGVYDAATAGGYARGNVASDILHYGLDRQGIERDYASAYQNYLASAPRPGPRLPAAPVYNPAAYGVKTRQDQFEYDEHYQQQLDDYYRQFPQARQAALR